MKRTISFAVMLAIALSGCVTAAEQQQQFDADLYEQMHATALALATKVDRGEMSREDATLQLVQMQLMTLANKRNSAAVQDAASRTPVAASTPQYQPPLSITCNTLGHILSVSLSNLSTREDHDCKNEQRRGPPG